MYMNIVNKDMRVLTDVTPINYQRTKESIIFYEMWITGNFAGDIEDMIKWDVRFVPVITKKVLFWIDTWIEVFDMWGNLFVVEYEDVTIRDRDIQLIKKSFQQKGKFSQERKNERQIPEFDGYFDYNGKYYTIIDGLNALTDEINPEKWIYKWVIIHPSRYFQIHTESQEISEKVKGIL